MKHIHTFSSFLNEAANESTLEISGNAYAMWNDKKIQRELDPLKFKIVGDMKGVMTLSGDKEELNKVRVIFGIKESVVNEGVNESLLKENFKVKGSLDMRELQDRLVEIKFNKFGIGYSWTDKFGKEKYEEGSFADAKSFDEILKGISEEILYQEENKK